MVYRKIPIAGRRPVEHMGEIRRGEAPEACDRLGVRAEDVIFLWYPDFGTLAIWQQHWGDSAALRSLLTHARVVSYNDAYRPGAPCKGEALYLFTRVALRDLAAEMQPEILPYLVHYGRGPYRSGTTRRPEASGCAEFQKVSISSRTGTSTTRV